MLHYDHYYTIGKTHRVCEDFAIQGNNPTPFLVLSDGCSGSDNTEIGARVLTLSTKKILEKTEYWPIDYINFGSQLINTAWEVVRKMQLPGSVLDATVMLAFLHQDQIRVYVYGDGCLFFKDQAGNLGTIEISFTHNAPYYLTYWYDKARQREYAKYGSTPLLVKDSRQEKFELQPFQTELVFSFPLQEFQLVAIASDGAAQCVDINKRRKLPLDEVAANLLTFSNFTDEFVKRHAENTLELYARQGIYPADDLSIGVFAQHNHAVKSNSSFDSKFF